MKDVPFELLQILDKKEIALLTKFYFTDLRKVYIRKLKRKYSKLLKLVD